MGVFAGPEITESGLVLALDAANKKSYSQNEFQYSTDIVTFSGTAANAATITRDTISSPVGNTPLKMVVTGNDPHIGMYNTPSTNIAPATNGQTWIVSVYIKANVATTGQIFIFGAAADGNVFDAVTGQITAGGVSIGTDWTRVSYAFTFTKGISFIQVRLDGPDTGGTGQTVWWDGLQVERVPSGTTTPTPFTSAYYGGSVYRDLVGSNNGTLVNGPTYSSANGGSLVFDGTNDVVNSTTSIIDRADGQEITVSCWIKPSRTSGQYSVFCTNRSNDASIYNWIFYQHITDGAIAFHGDAQNKSSYVPTINVWINVTNTVTASGVSTLYVNGVSTYTVTGYTYGNGTPSRLGIGADPGGQEPFQGNIANTQIYNRTLSAAEIQQNFNATRSRYSI
jgi:hypothetical protein